ncbi:MAG TPA: hypothetical protein VKY74_06875 [Chloroflexia bacterium]|nr:hypothetical protein [Chloroflexia bacterium]
MALLVIGLGVCVCALIGGPSAAPAAAQAPGRTTAAPSQAAAPPVSAPLAFGGPASKAHLAAPAAGAPAAASAASPDGNNIVWILVVGCGLLLILEGGALTLATRAGQ